MHKNRPIWLIQSPVISEIYPLLVKSRLTSSPPMGILSIATYLEKHGFEAHVSDMLIKPIKQDEFASILEAMKPAVLGLSVYSITCLAAHALAKAAKKIIPDLKVVFGGQHPTFTYEEIIEHSDVDFVVVGEGEITFLELCKTLYSSSSNDVGKVSGLVFKSSHGVVVTDPRPLISKLDDLPIARRDFVDIVPYQLPINMNTSRGCYGRCTFCMARAFWGKQCRYRSMANLENELDYLLDNYDVADLVIYDSTFTANVRRLRAFCDMLKRKEQTIRWSCMSRVDIRDMSLFRDMYEGGCRKILFGAESGDDKILKSIGKNTTCEQIKRTVKSAVEAGIYSVCSFMLGHPEDTIETVRKTIALIRYLKDEYGCPIVVSMNTPYPGSPQHKNAESLGLKLREQSWNHYSVAPILVKTKYLSSDVIRDLNNWKTEFAKDNTADYDPV
jgi:anaerobic magnesium-protoporphyrin IX monomethyl ester cyclase